MITAVLAAGITVQVNQALSTTARTEQPAEGVEAAYGPLRRRLDAVASAPSGERDDVCGVVKGFVAQELRVLEGEERANPVSWDKHEFSLDDRDRMVRFGNAFKEILARAAMGGGLDSVSLAELPGSESEFLLRLHRGFELAMIHNTCNALLRGISSPEDIMPVLRERCGAALDSAAVEPDRILFEIPRPGSYRVFVPHEVHVALSPDLSAQARAFLPRDENGVAFTLYRTELLNDQSYREENIPHETLHTLWRYVAGVFDPPSPDVSRFEAVAWREYREEALCQIVGGTLNAYCSSMREGAFREKFEQADPDGFAKINADMNAIYEIFNDRNPDTLQSAARRAGLEPVHFASVLLMARSFGDLRTTMAHIRATLLDAFPPEPQPFDPWVV